MMEILLLSILGLAALVYTGLWFWTRKRNRRLQIEAGRMAAVAWEDEMRRKQHREFNQEYLDSLPDADREKFLREWKGE